MSDQHETPAGEELEVLSRSVLKRRAIMRGLSLASVMAAAGKGDVVFEVKPMNQPPEIDWGEASRLKSEVEDRLRKMEYGKDRPARIIGNTTARRRRRMAKASRKRNRRK